MPLSTQPRVGGVGDQGDPLPDTWLILRIDFRLQGGPWYGHADRVGRSLIRGADDLPAPCDVLGTCRPHSCRRDRFGTHDHGHLVACADAIGPTALALPAITQYLEDRAFASRLGIRHLGQTADWVSP